MVSARPLPVQAGSPAVPGPRHARQAAPAPAQSSPPPAGTNQLHGSLYEFLRNDKFDGTNFMANRSGAKKPTLRQNQFGGIVGGPVIKNRTFFFYSYQGTRVRRGQSFVSTVPGEAARGGSFGL